MALPLNAEMLASAYDYFCATPPFNKWNLPPSEEVSFKVVRDPHTAGWHKMVGDKHIIGISSGAIGRTHSLMEVMAHELIHAHQRETAMETKGAVHNAAFNKLAARVCAIHGFDAKLF
jgi:hypothetical protein